MREKLRVQVTCREDIAYPLGVLVLLASPSRFSTPADRPTGVLGNSCLISPSRDIVDRSRRRFEFGGTRDGDRGLCGCLLRRVGVDFRLPLPVAIESRSAVGPLVSREASSCLVFRGRPGLLPVSYAGEGALSLIGLMFPGGGGSGEPRRRGITRGSSVFQGVLDRKMCVDNL